MGLAVRKDEHFTYADYLAWDDGERWELIGGQAFNMTPAPNKKHQDIAFQLVLQIGNQLKGKPCKAYFAPFDVLLPLDNEKEGDIPNVVQPDISIICDTRKLNEKGCLGAPDVIIEILSPETSRKDKKDKFFLYEQAGVKEYWLVSPWERLVHVFYLEPDGRYGRPEIYDETSVIQLKAVRGLTIELNPIFKAADM